MVAALRFRVNGDYDAYFYPVGTYNKIDWENELPCQLGIDYSVYLSKSEDNIEAIDIVNGLDGKPILRLIETKQYIIKLDKRAKISYRYRFCRMKITRLRKFMKTRTLSHSSI